MESSTGGKSSLLSTLHPLTYLLHRGPAAEATQGVPRSVYKLFGTRGEAIVTYQVALLRGDVLLMNERGNSDEGEADEEVKA